MLHLISTLKHETLNLGILGLSPIFGTNLLCTLISL